MILSDKSIRANNIVHPCEDRTKFRGKSYGLSCCGYDVRVDLENLDDWAEYPQVMTPDGDGISLAPGKSILAGIIETFDMPNGVVGFPKDKSTWLRQGVFIGAPVFEPGWHGVAALRIFNMGDEAVTIVHGEPIAQIVFQWLDAIPTYAYDGKYQGTERGDYDSRFEE